VQADPARLTGGTGAFAVASAREVRRHGLLAQTARVGRDIQAEAANPVRSPHQLIEAAAGRLRALEPASTPAPRPSREASVLAMPGRAALRASALAAGREAAQ